MAKRKDTIVSEDTQDTAPATSEQTEGGSAAPSVEADTVESLRAQLEEGMAVLDAKNAQLTEQAAYILEQSAEITRLTARVKQLEAQGPISAASHPHLFDEFGNPR